MLSGKWRKFVGTLVGLAKSDNSRLEVPYLQDVRVAAQAEIGLNGGCSIQVEPISKIRNDTAPRWVENFRASGSVCRHSTVAYSSLATALGMDEK